MFSAVYSNLLSENPEDWANAAHGCRRVLHELADTLFPPQEETRSRSVNEKDTEIKLGSNHYINRLLAYVEDSSASRPLHGISWFQFELHGSQVGRAFSRRQ